MIGGIHEMALSESDIYEGGHGLFVSLITDDGHNIACSTRGGCPATFGHGNPMLDPPGLSNNGGQTKAIATDRECSDRPSSRH